MTVGTRSFLDAAKRRQESHGTMGKVSERHPKRKQGGDYEHEQLAALLSKDMDCRLSEPKQMIEQLLSFRLAKGMQCHDMIDDNYL